MPEENKDLARRFMDEVWNKGNVDFIDKVVASNYAVYDPNSPEGISGGVEGAKQFVEMYRSALPDTQMTVEVLVAEGDKVVTRWAARTKESLWAFLQAATGWKLRVSA